MAKLRESVGENTEMGALIDALNRICDRSQPQFTNPLTVKRYDPSLEMRNCGHHTFLYVAEVRTKYRLGIFPCKWYRKLFAINPGFYGGLYGNREIICAAFDRSILEIVKEEVQKYADAFQATAVNLTLDFAR